MRCSSRGFRICRYLRSSTLPSSRPSNDPAISRQRPGPYAFGGLPRPADSHPHAPPPSLFSPAGDGRPSQSLTAVVLALSCPNKCKCRSCAPARLCLAAPATLQSRGTCANLCYVNYYVNHLCLDSSPPLPSLTQVVQLVPATCFSEASATVRETLPLDLQPRPSFLAIPPSPAYNKDARVVRPHVFG